MYEVEIILRCLGGCGKYQGFHYLIYAVQQVLEDEGYLLMINKRLYPAVAKQFNSTPGAIERSMRTVVDLCWQYGNRELFTELAGRNLIDKPSTTEFIDIIASYLKLYRAQFGNMDIWGRREGVLAACTV